MTQVGRGGGRGGERIRGERSKNSRLKEFKYTLEIKTACTQTVRKRSSRFLFLVSTLISSQRRWRRVFGARGSLRSNPSLPTIRELESLLSRILKYWGCNGPNVILSSFVY